MTKIKIKQLKALADRLADIDPEVSRQLRMLVFGAENMRHRRPLKVSAGFTGAIEKVVSQLPVHVLVGGMAVRFHVQTRVTDDVDFAIMANMSEIKRLFPSGRMGSLAYSVEVDGVDVDFLFSEDFPWTKAAISHGVDGSAVFHTKVNVASPEYLILYKLEAAREYDINDIKALLQLPGIADRAKKTVAKYLHYMVEDFDQLIEESKLGL